jgi:hypothetical protein
MPFFSGSEDVNQKPTVAEFLLGLMGSGDDTCHFSAVADLLMISLTVSSEESMQSGVVQICTRWCINSSNVTADFRQMHLLKVELSEHARCQAELMMELPNAVA